VTPDPCQELRGFLGVEAAARRVRHYRYAEERLMRTMAGWIALTPELPAKLLLGRQVWDCAQHADLWGRRLPELRAPAQVSEPPNEAFVRFMDRLEAPDGYDETLERLAGVYQVLKPHLIATYGRHLERTNPIYEPPTRRILERCLAEERRHVEDGTRVLQALAGGGGSASRVVAWTAELRGLMEAAGGVTGGLP
jgi:1,2-phenylacetyl-CoA epoxidase catalytic subunit